MSKQRLQQEVDVRREHPIDALMRTANYIRGRMQKEGATEDQKKAFNKRLEEEMEKITGFYFSAVMAFNLYFAKNAVMNQDWDYCLIVDGDEGAGKSLLSFQLAYFLDKDHSIDVNKQIVFYPEEFESAVLSLDKFKVIIWDESMNGANRRQSLSEFNVAITDLLSRCRQRNLFLILVLPSYYSIDEYIAVHRARCLCHVYTDWNPDNWDKPLIRGMYRLYNKVGMRELYTNPYNRRGRRHPFISRHSYDLYFTGHYVVDEKAYRHKKWEVEEIRRDKKNKEPTTKEPTIKEIDLKRIPKQKPEPYGY